MSANLLFMLIMFAVAMLFYGISSYKSNGLVGLLAFMKGILVGCVLIVSLMLLHVGIHCKMETCEASAFYSVFR